MRRPRYKYVGIAILLLAISLFPANRIAAAEEWKKVLFISSYNEGYEIVPEEIKGIKSGFAGQNVTCDIEYMDMKRFNTVQNIENFYQLLSYKLSKLPAYDAIIVGDDDALRFAIQYQGELFAGIPIVFIGINDLSAAQAAADLPFITGIQQDTPLDKNIALALSINPKATRVVAFLDATLTGQGEKEQFYQYEEEFPMLEFDSIDVSQYTFEEVGDQVEKIGDDTILLYMNLFTDKTGAYHEVDDIVRFLVQHSRVPLYLSTAGGLGHGVLGGKTTAFDETGKLAAQIALDILSGTPVDSIEMEKTSPSHYYFDYAVMEEFGILESDLPKDSIFINKQVSFYEQYKKQVWIVAGVFAALILVTFIIMIDNIRIRRADRKLFGSNLELKETYNKLLATEEDLRKQYGTIQEYAREIAVLNQKYELAIKGTDSAVWEIRMDTEEIFISPSRNDIFQHKLKENEKVMDLLKRLFSEEIQVMLLNEYDNFQKDVKNELDIQFSIQVEAGVKWLLVRGQGVRDTNGKVSLLHGIILDITKIKEQELNIQNMANNDHLTGIPNRMYFEAKLKEELEAERVCIVILLDIDNFKIINDTMGHAYGDQLLIEVARRLVQLVDQRLLVSRIGGDEFLVLISDAQDNEVIEHYMQLIKDVFNRPFLLDCKEKIISVSMGITRYPDDGKDVNQLIMNADIAMYKVKHGGKNSAVYYTSKMKEELNTKEEIHHILQEALENNGFKLLYQPQVDIITGEISSFEALIRLKHYTIPPSEFIGVAEETDLISEIGRFVTKSVVKKIASWTKEGKEPKKIAINFSSKQIRDLTYVEFLKKLLNDYQIEAKFIEIEITESMFFEKSAQTLGLINEFRELGISIALDDFGTGFSSLSYLTYIPVDKIKLDKSLSDKFLKMDNDSVINSIISLVHGLKLKITAEGIEEIDQYRKLKAGDCDYIQGYLFSEPLSEEDVELLYDKNFMSQGEPV